jgi:hypothetical protein
MELAWRESEADFSLKSCALLASYDPASFSWKTSQQSLFGGLTEFSWSSLRSGSIVDGQLCQPPKLAQCIAEKDGGYLPTPTASIEGSNCSPGSTNKKMGLSQLARKGLLPTPKARDYKPAGITSDLNRNSPGLPATMGGSLNPQFVEEIMGYHIDWTALDALVTAWFRYQQKKHS